jgi:hypothetical protein
LILFVTAECGDGRARCHARKARPELSRLFKEKTLNATTWAVAADMGLAWVWDFNSFEALHPRRWSSVDPLPAVRVNRLLEEELLLVLGWADVM